MHITEHAAGGGTSSPHLFAYTVQEYETAEGKKARSWTRIGVAFPHKDGTGFNIELHSLPLDGRIVLFPPSDDAHDDRSAAVPEPAPAAAPTRNGNATRRR
jgi:hypothetical protein